MWAFEWMGACNLEKSGNSYYLIALLGVAMNLQTTATCCQWEVFADLEERKILCTPINPSLQLQQRILRISMSVRVCTCILGQEWANVIMLELSESWNKVKRLIKGSVWLPVWQSKDIVQSKPGVSSALWSILSFPSHRVDGMVGGGVVFAYVPLHLDVFALLGN